VVPIADASQRKITHLGEEFHVQFDYYSFNSVSSRTMTGSKKLSVVNYCIEV